MTSGAVARARSTARRYIVGAGLPALSGITPVARYSTTIRVPSSAEVEASVIRITDAGGAR